MTKKFICTKNEPVVDTKAGKIRGFYFDDTYTFHGIKYADAKRFMMPEPVKPWQGVKDALHYGEIAPLLDYFDLNTEMLSPHRLWPQSEDCQYLNVWSGNLDASAKKPVMVWLHGGGYSGGSSIEQVAYEGANLSKFGDVVVVSLNHRLNILGFLDMSAYRDKYSNTGNLGMADIVEALRWIKDNIAAFGGDPQNVTVFGQSGGGGKVRALCQIPEATGLFHKAIVMSGVFRMNFGPKRDDRKIVDLMLKELGITAAEVEQLETLPFDKLAEVYTKAGKALGARNVAMMLGPTPNEWYLGDQFDVGFSENAKKIPTMAGTVIAEFSAGPDIEDKDALTADERKELVAKKYGDATDELIKLFKKAYPDKNEVTLLSMDAIFREPTLEYLKAKSEVASAPVYSYMFSLDFEYDGGKPAWHCSDIPFAFHNASMIPICNIEGVSERLEEQVCGAYVNFAKTGDPNHPSLPEWPKFSPENKATMVFDRKSEVREDYERELLELLKKSAPPFDFSSFGSGDED